MTRTIICLLTILLIMGIVGWYEYRYAQQEARHEQVIGNYKLCINSIF